MSPRTTSRPLPRAATLACTAVCTAVSAAVLLAGCAATSAVDDGVPPRGAVPTAPPAPTAKAAASTSGATSTSASSAACNPELTYAPPATLPAPAAFPAGSLLAKIRGRGRLIAGVTSDVRYFGVRNPQSHDIEGFDIDQVRALSLAIFGVPNKIEFKVFPPAQRIPLLKDGTIDIVARTMTATCDRWKEINFSAPYLRGQQKLLTRRTSGWKGMKDALAAGARLCGAAGSTGMADTKALRARYHADTSTVVEVESLNDCMALYLTERVDGLVSDNVLLAGLLSQDPFASVVVGEPELTVQPIALGLPKDAAFTSFVNGVLAQTEADGRWEASYRRWLATVAGASSTPPVPAYGRTT